MRRASGFGSSMTRRSGDRTALIRFGCICTPSLAIAAVIMAICSGVARTSRWPIDRLRQPGRVQVRPGSRSLGVVQLELVAQVLAEAELRRPGRRWPSRPRSRAMLANGVLQDCCRAKAKAGRVPGVAVAAGVVGQLVVRCRGRAFRPGWAARCPCCTCPEFSAAAVSTSLNTEPGASSSPVGPLTFWFRLIPGTLFSSLCWPLRRAASWVAIRLGS